ncbi:hypothetical protein O181_016078 [Austropuccinia psidii MF-1]|uniref:Uncharacterized protein n=1 Tax=Austropuccinia psidii MF-1 TaxID=1389203 RepID=A0A9Q3GQJ0_9BASI|nr:hypothetical protein [Austropuccinia psidii MF-1]
MKPQPQGHILDDPYQEDIKHNALLVNKARSPSQYKDGDNMSYSEKEALKYLPEASNWPKFSGTGEYNCMGLVYYSDTLFIDGNIPNLESVVSKRNKLSGWTSKTNAEKMAEVTKKKNTFHNCGSTDQYANNFQKAKKKVYTIEKVPEEESPTEDSESDSMGDAIRE